MFFASDNGSAAAPEIMAAVLAENAGYAMPYGNDPVTARVCDLVRACFDAPGAAVYLVATGTAANALALAILTPPWGAVFCHRHAHIAEDECGAPEFFTAGSKLVLVDGAHGRMTPDALRAALDASAGGGVHNVQRGCVSLTDTTEAGTVYTASDIRALADVARGFGLPVHLDGARFANAVAATGATPAEMTWKAGVDVLSLGGTKNGCLGVEAVVIFDPARAWEFELRRKRAGHLFSKNRFLAAQMQAYLTGDLWLRLAGQANAMAARLAEGLARIEGAALLHPVGANIVFAQLPRTGHLAAQAEGARYYVTEGETGDGPVTARLVCSWSTTVADIDGFLALMRG